VRFQKKKSSGARSENEKVKRQVPPLACTDQTRHELQCEKLWALQFGVRSAKFKGPNIFCSNNAQKYIEFRSVLCSFNHSMRIVSPSNSKMMSVPIHRQTESGFNKKHETHFAVSKCIRVLSILPHIIGQPVLLVFLH
jgi:hypothetical protein